MPHSSGGGHSGGHSSGGGHSHSHSSHHSSGGGYSQSAPKVYRSYSPGRHVFVSYRSGRPRYYYSDHSYESTVPKRKHSAIVDALLLALPWLTVAVILLVIGLVPPKKVTTYLHGYRMYDDADCFTQEEESSIEDAVHQYYALTGIPICIHTITEEEYQASGESSLEAYAYDDYVTNLYTENYWLIVFEDIDGSSRKWAFEGMQGDNTDEWLTALRSRQFNRKLSENLDNREMTYGEAFASSISYLADLGYSGNLSILIPGLVFLLIGIAIGAVMFFSALRDEKLLREYHEVKIPTEDRQRGPQLVVCDYCGGTYVYGETLCPHCGAPGKTVYNG